MPGLHALAEFVTVSYNAGLYHLPKQVVALAGTLSDSGEHREAVVSLGDIVDKFHNQDGLAHSCASEKADLAALHIRFQQIDDLYAGIEDLLSSGHIEQTALDLVACRHGDGPALGPDLQVPLKSVGRFHRYGAYGILPYMLLHFHRQSATVLPDNRHRLVYRRKMPAFPEIREMYIHHRAYYL